MSRILFAHRAVAIGLVMVCVAGCAALPDDRKFDDVTVVGLSPDPAEMPDPIVQVFAARSWEPVSRLFSVHTWIAYKPAGAERYTVMETSEWDPYPPALKFCDKRRPDRRWHGATPSVITEVTGRPAERAIHRIQELAMMYPELYAVWPGPNSNSFTAYIMRNTPELRAELPPTAIGKDYFVEARVLSASLSGTGVQLSINGLFGFTAAIDEGIEVNILGLVFGIDFSPPAVKLPIIGRVGIEDSRTSRMVLPYPPECRCGWTGRCRSIV